MKGGHLISVIVLALAYLPAASAAPSTPIELLARHDHHHDHGDPQPEASASTQSTHDEHDPDPMPASTMSTSSVSTHMHTHRPTPPDPHAHGHGHGHGHHVAQVELNDTDVHYYHHFPPSYLAADFRLAKDQVIFGEELDDAWVADEAGGQRDLAFAHAGTFVLAYFGFLPIALALRAAGHSAHHIVSFVFLATATVSWLLVVAYRAATPDRYAGSSHALLNSALYFLSVGLTVFDSLTIVKTVVSLYRTGEFDGKRWRDALKQVLHASEGADRHHGHGSRYEMVGLTEADGIVFALGDDDDDNDGEDGARDGDHHDDYHRRRGHHVMRPTEHSLILQQYPSRSAPSRSSTGSDGTLHDFPLHDDVSGNVHLKQGQQMGAYNIDGPSLEERAEAVEEDEASDEWIQGEKGMTVRRFGEICLTWVRRTQVVLAYVTFLSGFVVYTGMCRASFLPSCLAHYIKGSIFFGYGVLTFARYLGAYADLGWAWNRRPDGKRGLTAEMVECAVIFTYGITQTWMERIGSHTGDPYTVKQVQHISIAVMFWFAGLGGMLLESKWMRRIMSNIAGKERGQQVEPASYAFSFNPLPALVIAVTGLAMAAHHQNYVEIHSLWGILLAGGSVFRMLTYFFLFLRPPVESDLPSRPPTEILTSFGWAAGGIVFMLSNEEITFAAMRTGYDDMMAFLNFTIALTSAIFCWEVVVMAVKGWAVGRVNDRGRRNSARV